MNDFLETKWTTRQVLAVLGIAFGLGASWFQLRDIGDRLDKKIAIQQDLVIRVQTLELEMAAAHGR